MMEKERKGCRVDYLVIEEFVDNVIDAFRASESSNEASERITGIKQVILDHALSYWGDSGTRKWISNALKILKSIVDEIAEGYSSTGYYVIKPRFVLSSPGLVGAGSGLLKPVFEIGISIHPLFGLPYYPGSGIKGAVRAFTEVLLGENVANQLFGDTGDSGSASTIVFSDMFPIGCSKSPCSVYRGLVITPHYHRGGRAVPNELYVVPSPLPHLGIEEGVVFSLVVAVHSEKAKKAYVVLRNRLLGSQTSKGICSAQLAEAQPFSNLCAMLKNAAEKINEAGRALAITTYLLLTTVMNAGIASRSTKGYNVFKEYRGSLSFDVIGYSYEPPQRYREGRQRTEKHYSPSMQGKEWKHRGYRRGWGKQRRRYSYRY